MRWLGTFFALIVSVSAWAIPPESQITFPEGVFSYYASGSLTARNETVERVIITVHGSERNADTYYNSIELIAAGTGRPESIFILSPHFKERFDPLLPREFTWTSEGWLRGDPSLQNGGVSSFTIMDRFMEFFGNRETFPNLRTIVLVGHSAGGQLTQRYALGTLIDTLYPELRFRFVVANPGSFAYVTSARPVVGRPGVFAVPNTACRYDEYKYGLRNLNSYQSRRPVAENVARYVARDVTYLAGEKDIDAPSIDQTCPARFQGNTRFERANHYHAFMKAVFPENKHQLVTVPNVGHTQYGMYTSETGRAVLLSDF